MLSVLNLTKKYGSVQALKPTSFDVRQGDFFTLLGPSGCGKTTTLQCIAGLETPSSGKITMGDRVIYCGERNTFVPANKRKLGMVFQSYAIWPHMSVFENVAFPLLHGDAPTPRHEVRPRVMKALELVKLSHLADRPSPHLSGGQQQRIALARALVHEPKLLLLDEPLSNLDEKLRESMRSELRQLVKSLGITTIFVTHDQTEALSMSDSIALMRDGQIVQLGTPKEIYLHPTTAFCADFMGRSNLIPGSVNLEKKCVETVIGPLKCNFLDHVKTSDFVYFVTRPRAITVLGGASDPLARSENARSGRVERINFLGDTIEAEILIGAFLVRAFLDPYLNLNVGDEIWVEFRPDRSVVVSQADFQAPQARTFFPQLVETGNAA